LLAERTCPKSTKQGGTILRLPIRGARGKVGVRKGIKKGLGSSAVPKPFFMEQSKRMRKRGWQRTREEKSIKVLREEDLH